MSVSIRWVILISEFRNLWVILQVNQLCGHLLPPTGKEKDRGDDANSSNDRLTGLITKGRFYEGCVDYCQAQVSCSFKMYFLKKKKKTRTC